MNIVEQCNRMIENQKNYMRSIPVEKYWENSWKYAPTRYLTENLEPLVKKIEYKTYKKNGKPYLIECVLCLYEKDFDKKVMADYRFGYARVHPNDTFNEKIGQHLAYTRALANENKIEGLTGKLYKEVDRYNTTFRWDMDPTPMEMLELVRSCMPKITKNKVFKELAVETNQENVVYFKKAT